MRSLWVKLVLAFLLVSLVGAAIAAVMARRFTKQEFNNLVLDRARENFITKVTDYYEIYHTWDGVALLYHMLGNPGSVLPSNPGEQMILPPAFALADTDGTVIVSAGEYQTGQRVSSGELKKATMITVDGEVVGYVVNTRVQPNMDTREQNYVRRTDQVLLFSAIASAVISIILGIILARSFTQPVRALTGAAREVARGERVKPLPVKSKDELGELTMAFNQMNEEIATAAEQRRQMTADIAHDLRTPLT